MGSPAREWGSDYATGKGAEYTPPPANSAPMKSRITKFLLEVVWQNICIVSNCSDPRALSSMSNKFQLKKIINFVENAYLRFLGLKEKTIMYS